jgi:2-polyprenyl-3-methyl-5-hydroxy-6-metoxy-1,4-benzoquinol methylase
MSDWDKGQEWEAKWHGNCANSYQEESKQIDFANRMGLTVIGTEERYPVIRMDGKSILDIGGGPYSLLLKCENVYGTVLDPCTYPEWTAHRYAAIGVGVIKQKAETWQAPCLYDEVWMYNVLQHVEDPAQIVRNLHTWGKIIRVHEWTGTAVAPGHPNTFTPETLDALFGAVGFTEPLGNGIGAWYGVFAGRTE